MHARVHAINRYWEQQIYGALTQMIVTAMQNLMRLLSVRVPGEKGAVSKAPLFKIQAHVSPPDVSSSPPLTEIRKVVGKMVGNLVSSPKQFVRWYRHSCIEVKADSTDGRGGEEEPTMFTFYTDTSQDQQVLKMMLMINQANNKTFSKIKDTMEKWKKWFPLWRSAEEAAKFEKFAQKNPTCVQFDGKLLSKMQKSLEVDMMPIETTVDFVKISNLQVTKTAQRPWLPLPFFGSRAVGAIPSVAE